jgi:predicted ferric reductase
LYTHIKTDCTAYFEGPYGRLDYRAGGHSQIWVVGGIGVVLFLAWTRSMSKHSDGERNIDFYYCVHRVQDAIFHHEFLEFSKAHPGFRVFLYCTEEGNRLDIDKVISNSG